MSNDKDVTTTNDLPAADASAADGPSSPQKRPGKWEGLAACGVFALLVLPIGIPSLFLLYYGVSVPAVLLALPISFVLLVFFMFASGHDLMDVVVHYVLFTVMALLVMPGLATARVRVQAERQESMRRQIVTRLLDREATAKQQQRHRDWVRAHR